MQPSAAVVARVHDEGVAGLPASESLGIDFAEAGGIHPLHVHVTDAASGEFLGHLLAPAYPAGIEIVGVGCRRYDVDLLGLAVVLQGDEGALAALVEQRVVPGLSGFHGLSVDGEDLIARSELGICHGEAAAGQHLGNLEARAFPVLVEEDPEATGRQLCGCAAVACSGMGTVEFTEHLGEQVLEIEVVVYIGEELRVVVVHSLPVHAVDCGVVELLVHLLPAVFEDVGALLGGPVVELRIEADGRDLAEIEVHLRKACRSQEEDVLPVLVRNERAEN